MALPVLALPLAGAGAIGGTIGGTLTGLAGVVAGRRPPSATSPLRVYDPRQTRNLDRRARIDDPSVSQFSRDLAAFQAGFGAPFRPFGGYFASPDQPTPAAAATSADAGDAARTARGFFPGLGAGVDVTGAPTGGGAGGVGGGVSIAGLQSLFQLAETPEEQAALAFELADLEARRAAGELALSASWQRVAETNRQAAEKARTMAQTMGTEAAGLWSAAADQARQRAEATARAEGATAGMPGLDVSPSRGAEEFIRLMETMAPIDAAYAQRQGDIIAEDLGWAASVAAGQEAAYVGDLNRQAQLFGAERAREHNLRVQERIASERMMLAQMQFQAQMQAAQLAAAAAGRDSADPFTRFQSDLELAFETNSPEILVQRYGIAFDEAQELLSDFETRQIQLANMR